jgi:SH3 domain protein
VKFFIYIALLATFALSVQAESRYIDDTFYVPLRSGEGLNFRIVHKGVKSGTKVELIQTNPDSGYSEVKTPDGIEGYLPTRFLVTQPIAKDRLAAMQSDLKLAQTKEKTAEQELAALQQKYSELNTLQDKTSKQLDAVSKELDNIKTISSGAINLDAKNRGLRESNEKLRNELELLKTDNLRLKDKSESNMMLFGGMLVLAGIIIALILPMLKISKKHDSWA